MRMSPATHVQIDALPCSIQMGLRVKDMMREFPTVVTPDTPMSSVVATMDEQRLPLVAVGNGRTVYGIITDGEIIGGFARQGAGFPGQMVGRQGILWTEDRSTYPLSLPFNW